MLFKKKQNTSLVPMLVVKVGDRERPAGEEDIKDAHRAVIEALATPGPAILVTHHAIELEVVHVPVQENGIKINVIADAKVDN